MCAHLELALLLYPIVAVFFALGVGVGIIIERAIPSFTASGETDR